MKIELKKPILGAGKQKLFTALGQADPNAIRVLADKIRPELCRRMLRIGFFVEDVDELLNDVLVITISNIRKQTFTFQDFHPAAYALGVARKLIANRVRSRKPRSVELTEELHAISEPEDTYYADKERQAIVGQLLDQLGDPCRKILVLKYFEYYRDKELLEKRIVAFSTLNSLKSKRSQCLKMLAELAKAAGITKVF